MDKLSPCRKCKAIPEYSRVGDRKQYWVVICPSCGNHEANFNEARSTKWGARRIWNRRAGDNG